MDNSFSFKTKVYSTFLQFVYNYDYINIKGYKDMQNPLASLVYDASYQDFTLPEEIQNIYHSAEKLYFYLCDISGQLQLMKDCLAFRPKFMQQNKSEQKQQYLYLPLRIPQNPEDNNLQLQTLPSSCAMKPVQKMNDLPYKSVVRIISKHRYNGVNFGSGVIIGKNKIMTVAHNMYVRRDKSEAFQVKVFVHTNAGQKQVKVRKHVVPKEYYQTNVKDMNNYDLAYIYLQQNDIIQEDQILEFYGKNIPNIIKYQVIGFSSILDDCFKKHNACYYLSGQKLLEVYQHYATSDYIAVKGISGGPVVHFDQQSEKWKIIGLHQAFKADRSQLIILSKFGRSTLQVAQQLDTMEESNLTMIANQQKKMSRIKTKYLQIHRKQALYIYQNGVQMLQKNQLSQSIELLKGCLEMQAIYPGRQTKQYCDTLEMIQLVKKKKQIQDSAQNNNESNCLYEIRDSLRTLQSRIEIGQINTSSQSQYQQTAYLPIEQQNQDQIQNNTMGKRLDSLGNKLYKKQDYDEALKVYCRALQFFERAFGIYTLAYAATLNNIGSIHQLKDNLKSAKQFYEKSIKTLRLINVKEQHLYYKAVATNIQNLIKKI